LPPRVVCALRKPLRGGDGAASAPETFVLCTRQDEMSRRLIGERECDPGQKKDDLHEFLLSGWTTRSVPMVREDLEKWILSCSERDVTST
jgi:hypothetical protein